MGSFSSSRFGYCLFFELIERHHIPHFSCHSIYVVADW